MTSRYDYMDKSLKKDVDDEYFPDPLSLVYSNFEINFIPRSVDLTQNNINKPWTIARDYNNSLDLEDIYLSLNEIPFIGYVKTGDIYYVFDNEDIKNFLEK